jgi:hypothetical protein
LGPLIFNEWTVPSSFIHVIPVPGRTVRAWGTNALFFIWMTVTTLADGDSVLFAVGGSITTTVVGTDVGTRVNSAVGTVVITVVADVVVTGSGTACWVHPMNATKAIIRINKPMNFFMESKLFSPYN